MAFVEWNQEAETFATKAAAESLAHRVRLWGPHWRTHNPYTQIDKTLVDIRREDAVPIVDDGAVRMIAWQRFPQLLQRPFRRGMAGDMVVENPPRFDLHDKEDREGAEGGGDHHEEVAGHHDLGMVADKSQPTLFRVGSAHRTLMAKVLADTGRPEWSASAAVRWRCVLLPRSDSLRPSRRWGFAVCLPAGISAPEETESCAVPAEEGIGLDVH
jgi:hypothetical protein